MNLAALSLIALAIAVTLSCTTKINVGILSMVLAWGIGVYLAGRPFSEITAGFPPAVPWQNYVIVVATHAIVAFSGYLIFGGWRLFRSENARQQVVVDDLTGAAISAAAPGKIPNGDIPDA